MPTLEVTLLRWRPRPLQAPGFDAAVADESLAVFARNRLIEPLGMASSFFRDTASSLPPVAARGHFEADDGRIHVEPATFHGVGPGGLWTTADDLARWDAAFYDANSITQRLTARGLGWRSGGSEGDLRPRSPLVRSSL
jgi:CubicO group peptidase (beta-lactamase class C family)